jgi:hypothetical protein
MFDLDGIETVLHKLKDKNEPGVLEIEPGKKHTRYSYIINKKIAFSFGITRSSKARSKKFYYVATQMGIKNKEYKKLHDCPWNKKDLNMKLIESKEV